MKDPRTKMSCLPIKVNEESEVMETCTLVNYHCIVGHEEHQHAFI